MKKNQKGFSTVLVLVVIAVLMICGFAGWRVLKNSKTVKTPVSNKAADVSKSTELYAVSGVSADEYAGKITNQGCPTDSDTNCNTTTSEYYLTETDPCTTVSAVLNGLKDKGWSYGGTALNSKLQNTQTLDAGAVTKLTTQCNNATDIFKKEYIVSLILGDYPALTKGIESYRLNYFQIQDNSDSDAAYILKADSASETLHGISKTPILELTVPLDDMVQKLKANPKLMVLIFSKDTVKTF